MKPFVTHSDPKWLETLKKRLNRLVPRKEVVVGFPRGVAGVNAKIYPVSNPRGTKGKRKGSQKIGGGASVLDVAVWNQFGTRFSPMRPFMTFSVEPVNKEAKRILNEARAAMRKRKKPLDAKAVERLLKEMGQAAVGKVRETILNSGLYVPNAPSTIALKGSSKPLVASRIMVKSVTYAVRDKE